MELIRKCVKVNCSQLFFALTLAVVLFVDKKEGDGASHVVVMPAPSKRGRKKKTTMSRVGPMGGPANETLILAHLTPGGQVKNLIGRRKYDAVNRLSGTENIVFVRWHLCSIIWETHMTYQMKRKTMAQKTALRHTGMMWGKRSNNCCASPFLLALAVECKHTCSSVSC